MDEFQCSWCSRSFYLKDGHFCFLEGKPDNEYSESFLDELEKLAERLEEATRNQDCASDDFRHSNPKTQTQDIQLNSSHDSDSNFLTRNTFRGEKVTSSSATSFITQCPGSNLDVPRSDSHVSVQHSIFEASEESTENSSYVLDETTQGDNCWTDDNNSNPSEFLSSQKESGLCNLRPVQQIKHKNTRFGTDASTCKKKENGPSQFILGKKRSYLDSIWASPTCRERDGHNAEALKEKKYSKMKTISAKVIQVDDSSNSQISTNILPLGSVADAETVSFAGPSGFPSQSHRTGKGKRFACNVCGKDFGNKYYLKVHHSAHTGEKPFLCPTCGKGFLQQGDLTRHLRTHTGEKPFVCDICGKGFTQKGHFDTHYRTHTGEKRFVCGICGKAFVRKDGLDIHYRTHTGDKPYACKICGKGFSAQSNLINHVPTHEGGKRYKCGVCGKTFSCNDSRNRHYKEKHQ